MLKSGTKKAKRAGRTKLHTARAPSAGNDAEVDNLPRPNKLLTIIAMSRRPDGAKITELSEATGWKPNSIRGAIGCMTSYLLPDFGVPGRAARLTTGGTVLHCELSQLDCRRWAGN